MLRPALIPLLASIISTASAADSFEAACDALNSTADIRVEFKAASAQLDESKAAREIALDDRKGEAFRHLGATHATLLRDVEVRLNGYTDERSGRACAWPKVKLTLTVRPLLIELAKELSADECMRAHVFDHEMRHVAIYNAAALRAGAQLQAEMRAHYQDAKLIGDADALMSELRAEIERRWLSRLDELIALHDREHEALDAAEESEAYAVCKGALAKLIKTME